MDEIIEYMKQKYNPLSIILYGSYANGTNNDPRHLSAIIHPIKTGI